MQRVLLDLHLTESTPVVISNVASINEMSFILEPRSIGTSHELFAGKLSLLDTFA